MNTEYKVKKDSIAVGEIDHAHICFANGEFFEVSKREIVDLKVEYYDKLIKGEGAYYPVAKSGYLKIKLSDKRPYLVHSDITNARSDRRGYLMRRCIEEVGASYFVFYDEYYWQKCFYASAVASIDGDYLIYTFHENSSMGAADSDTHTVSVHTPDKDSIFKIHLDFENCDGIEVFGDEIVEMNLIYNNELGYNPAYCYCREIVGGYISIRLDPDSCQYRKSSLCFLDNPTLKNLEERICGKGADEVDICHLYVDFRMPSHSVNFCECINLPNLCESPYSDEESDDDDEVIYDGFVSGYAEREEDGTIRIIFGKRLEDAEKS